MVPLDVGQVQALHEVADRLVQVVPRPGGAQVQDALAAVLDRPAGAVGQDPVGVGAGEVGVAVDHLRLEPQPQLHAQVAHVRGQGLQPGRPDLGRDPPVAQARGVVAPGPEPPVVDDEALDADGGRLVRERRQGLRVLVEVDGLPGVEQDRARPRGVGRLGAQVGVAAGRQGVQALAPGADEPGRGVGLAGAQGDLAGVEELARAQEPVALGRVGGQGAGVAGPGQVHAVDAAAAPAEAGGPRGQPGGGVVPGAALPGLAQPGARGEGGAHEAALEAVVTGHVDQLGGVGGHRQQRGDLVDLQRGGTLPRDVGHPRAQSHQAGGLQADLGDDLDAVGGVGAARDDDVGPAARGVVDGDRVGDGVDVGGEGGAVLAVDQEGGPGGPAQVGQGQHRQVGGGPGAVDAGAHRLGGPQVAQGGAVDAAEVLAPVAHHGEAVGHEVEDQGGAAPAQVAGRGRGGDGGDRGGGARVGHHAPP